MLKKPTLILIIFVIIFTGVYAWLVTPIETGVEVSHRFDWPDETANYFWSKNYAETGQLTVAEPLNIAAQNQIHPRSFNVRSDGALVPGSFLGLILFFGFLAKIFGTGIIIYLTPIFGGLAALALYGILKKIFSQQIAVLSAILLLFHPAWWYYSVTSMLPNVIFVSCLLISIYFLLRDQKNYLYSILLAGLFAGLALSIRPTEFIWLIVVYLVIFFFRQNKFNFLKIILFLVITALMVVPSLYQQQALYGDWLTSGYSQLDEQGTTISCQICQVSKSLLLPFGFHPTSAVQNFWTHYISRFWWLSLLAILGLVVYMANPVRQRNEIFGYVLLSLFIFGWLIIYYGSWQFSDLLTVHLNTLGLSYVRYWLPLYILALPFIATGLIWLTRFFRQRWANFILILLLIFLFYRSADLVLRAKPDSLLPVKNRIVTYKQNAAQVFELTESESVIVTVRKDKLFFPERKVIHTFQALSLNDELVDILANLVKVVPVYYYALGPEPSLELSQNLTLELVSRVGEEVLYKFQDL